MTDDVYYHLGAAIPRPRIFRIVRLFARQGRDGEVIRQVERVTRSLRETHADVPFRSYLAKNYGDDGTCEILVVSVWDRPEDMRRVVVSADIAARPFGIEDYADAVERWTVQTYEVFYPRPEDDL